MTEAIHGTVRQRTRKLLKARFVLYRTAYFLSSLDKKGQNINVFDKQFTANMRRQSLIPEPQMEQ